MMRRNRRAAQKFRSNLFRVRLNWRMGPTPGSGIPSVRPSGLEVVRAGIRAVPDVAAERLTGGAPVWWGKETQGGIVAGSTVVAVKAVSAMVFVSPSQSMVSSFVVW